VKQAQTRESLNDLLNDIRNNGTILEISLYCDREFERLDALVAEMNTITEAFLDAVERTLDLISCERIVPIYHKAIYDGACRYSVAGVNWLFATSLIMATMGLIMILLRSAVKSTIYQDANEEDAEEADQSECSKAADPLDDSDRHIPNKELDSEGSESASGNGILENVPIDDVDPNEEWKSRRGRNALEY
jgi:hypothetical protein